MAAVRDTIRAAAATCVEPARLEASGPYEWLAIVEAHNGELSRLLRSYIESCRYLDELQHGEAAFNQRDKPWIHLPSPPLSTSMFRNGLLETCGGSQSGRVGPNGPG